MSKSTKSMMKSLGEKLIGGKGNKGSFSSKDKGVVPPSSSNIKAKKKTLLGEEGGASLEAEAMDVDDVIPSPPNVYGRGKSLMVMKTHKESMQQFEKVKIVVD